MSRYKEGDRFIIEIEEETEEMPGVFKVKGDENGLYRETFFDRLKRFDGDRKENKIKEVVEELVYRTVCARCSGCTNCYEECRQCSCEDWNMCMRIVEEMAEVQQ